MPRYRLEINADRVNREETAFRFELRHAMNAEWGMETVNFPAGGIPTATMRLRQIVLTPELLLFETLIHCSIGAISFETVEDLPRSADVIPGQIEIGHPQVEEPWWWKLYSAEGNELIMQQVDSGLFIRRP